MGHPVLFVSPKLSFGDNIQDMCTIKGKERKQDWRKKGSLLSSFFPKAFLQFINAWTFQCLIWSHQFFQFTHDQIQLLQSVPRTTNTTKHNTITIIIIWIIGYLYFNNTKYHTFKNNNIWIVNTYTYIHDRFLLFLLNYCIK